MSLSSFSAHEKALVGILPAPIKRIKVHRMPKPWKKPVNPTYLDKPIVKLYYSIGEVSDRIGVHPSKVRFLHEYFGLNIKKGHLARMFTHENIEELRAMVGLGEYWNLSAIKLMRSSGVNLEDALKITLWLVGKQEKE